MTIREGTGGRRLLAVGAGVMLIGTLGAGPAFAGTSSSGDYDYDYYYSFKCDDYKYSEYYKSGYWYDKHDDRDEHEPGEKPGFELPDLTDLTPEELQDLLDLLDGLTPEQLQDVLDGLSPEQLEDLLGGLSPEQLQGLADQFTGGGLTVPPVLTDALGSAPTGGVGATALSTEEVPAEGTARGTTETETPETQENNTETPEIPENNTETPEIPENDTETPEIPETQENNTETTPETQESETVDADSVGGGVETSSSVSRLDDPDPKDEDDQHHEGYYRPGEKKYSYTSYRCYENTEKRHRWYDHREPGKVEATKVRTVPKGGVDTGN